MRYTDQQRQAAVDLYIEHGTAEAARRSGIPPRTIGRWAATAGASEPRSTKLVDGAEMLAKASTEKRAQLRTLLIDKTVEILTAVDPAKARDTQALMTAAAIGVDKFRLEMGEATGRTEVVDLAQAESTIDAEVARLAAQLGK